MKLYSYWMSTSSWRVRIALAYKGIEHDYVPVDLRARPAEQTGEAHRARNAMLQVPVLEIEIEDAGATRWIAQSMAIIEFLEERWPSPPLLPADPYLRARARQLAEIVNAGIQPFQNLSVLRLVKRELGGDEQAFARGFIERGLAAFQAAAQETAGRFCVGDAVSLADVLLVPQLHAARRFGIDLSALGLLVGIEQACAALPAFQAAQPDRQIDAPAGAA